MNSSDHHSPTPGGSPVSVSPELEARLVAWIAGEASPFEIAELERLVREQPTIAAAKRALETTHALLTAAAKPDATPLRLAAERRAKLLQEISTPAERADSVATSTSAKAPTSDQTAYVVSIDRARRQRQQRRSWMLVAAASCAVVTFLFVLDPTDLFHGSRPESAQTKIKSDADSQRLADQFRAKHESSPTIEDEKRRRLEAELRAQESLAEREIRKRAESVSKKQRTPARESVAPTQPTEASDLSYANLDPAPASAVLQKSLSEKPANTLSIDLPKLPPTATAAANGARARPDTTYGYFSFDAPASESADHDLRGFLYRQATPPSWSSPETRFGAKTDAVPAPTALQKLSTDASDIDHVARFEARYDQGFINPNASARTSFAEKAKRESPIAALSVEPGAVRLANPGGSNLAAGTSGSSALDDRIGGVPPLFGSDQLGTGRTDGVANQALLGGTSLLSQSTSAGRLPSRDHSLPRSTLAAPHAGPPWESPNGRRPKPDPEDLATEAIARQNYFATSIREVARNAAETNTAPPPAVPAVLDADAPLVRAPVIALPPLEEVSTAKEPVSTFSLHVADVSFRLAQKALAGGQLPAADTVRAEEFINAFRYGDLTPAPVEKVAARIEQAAHPLRQQRNLVRIAAKVPSTGRDSATPLRLTVLLDTSGSMEREDRAATVRAALHSLASLLGPNDRLTLIGFSRTSRLIVDSIAGDQVAGALEKLGALPNEGGTNLEEAFRTGAALAYRQFDAATQNRVVLLTDGAANLGEARPAILARWIALLRENRIAFDACGVGLDGLDDTVLETLTRQGDGRYYVLDTPAAADAGFARQLAGAFRPAAANVKVQVRFNPARVRSYRLIGFEKHRLATQDFRNDTIDAAELAADEDATAVYEIEASPDGTGELGDVFIRFRDTASGEMVERSWTMLYEAQAPQFDRATPTLRLAGTAALFADLLRNRPADLGARLDELAPVVRALPSWFGHDARVAEFVTMFEQARRIAGR